MDSQDNIITLWTDNGFKVLNFLTVVVLIGTVEHLCRLCCKLSDLENDVGAQLVR